MEYPALLIIGAVFIIFGIRVDTKYQRFLLHGRRTKAIIQSFNLKQGGTFPILKYKTLENREMVVESDYFSSTMSEGDKVEIIYLLKEPEKFVVAMSRSYVLLPIVSLALGITLIIAYFLI